jgi:hypothetical protein
MYLHLVRVDSHEAMLCLCGRLLETRLRNNELFRLILIQKELRGHGIFCEIVDVGTKQEI